MAVGAKTQNKQVGAATANILISLTAGKILSLTGMHGHGLRLKIRQNVSNKNFIMKMSDCIKDFFYYEHVKKSRVCKIISLKSNF